MVCGLGLVWVQGKSPVYERRALATGVPVCAPEGCGLGLRWRGRGPGGVWTRDNRRAKSSNIARIEPPPPASAASWVDGVSHWRRTHGHPGMYSRVFFSWPTARLA